MGEEPDAHAAIVETVEIFHAFICAYVAALHGSGLTRPRPVGYVEGEGWVILPTVVENRALPMPVFE
jgi:hypothetical protein